MERKHRTPAVCFGFEKTARIKLLHCSFVNSGENNSIILIIVGAK